MKASSFIKIGALLLALTGVSHAASVTWTTGTELHRSLTESNRTATGIFDLTTVGFNPSSMTITSATSYFAFADDSSSDSDEFVNISIDTSSLFTNLETGGSGGNNSSASFAWYSKSLNSSMILALRDDGKVSWTVQLQNTSGTNDTWLRAAALVAVGTKNSTTPTNPPHGVPDGGSTTALLGLGFIGLAALRRRMAK